MPYNGASNVWDLIKDGGVVPFRAEPDEALPENILSPEQDKSLLGIMDSLDKGRGWETGGEAEMSTKDSKVSTDPIKRGKVCTEDDQASAENAILTAQSELNALFDQLEPKVPTPK